MIHIFVTICFLGVGILSGQCLAEKKDPLSDDFASEEECHEFLQLLGVENANIIRKNEIEMHFRCAGQS